MTHTELKQIRADIKFSMQDVADFLRVPKSSYARWEDGTARIPAAIADKMKAYHTHDRNWMKGLVKKINADLKQRFPMGITSEAF